jgi:uncharacterized membrane protein
MENFRQMMEIVGTAVDGVGVFIVAAGAVVATARLLVRHAHNAGNYYSSYRQDIGRAILLGLEFLIAGDIIRTVVVAPTIQNVLVLGLIVLNPHVPEFIAPTGDRRKAPLAPRRAQRTSGLTKVIGVQH